MLVGVGQLCDLEHKPIGKRISALVIGVAI
jgi:hypothetical protein